MDIIYENTQEQYIETILREISERTSSKVKNAIIRLITGLIFVALCLSKYNYDNEIYGYLREDSSLVILIYLICGALWVVLLPIVWWKIKSVLVVKQMELKKINFQDDINVSLNEDGLTITTKDSKVKSIWNNVLKVTTKKRLIILDLKGLERVLIRKCLRFSSVRLLWREYICVLPSLLSGRCSICLVSAISG